MRLIIPKDLYTKLIEEANQCDMSLARYVLTLLYKHAEA